MAHTDHFKGYSWLYSDKDSNWTGENPHSYEQFQSSSVSKIVKNPEKSMHYNGRAYC